MTERAPSKRRLRRLAKRDAAAAQARRGPADAWRRSRPRRATAKPSRLTQFMTRLRVETRQVLTSPGLFVLTLFAIGNTATFLWFGQTAYGTADHPIVSATIDAVRGGFAIILVMIAGFYGGELVWRERDRKMNELIDSTPLPAWIMTVPKVIAIFLVLVVRQFRRHADRPRLSGARRRARISASAPISAGSSFPPRSTRCCSRCSRCSSRCLSPNKYVGWGLLFVWFVGTHLPQQHGLFEPALHLWPDARRAAQRFRRHGQLLDRRAHAAALLGAVRGHPAGRGASAVAARDRPRRSRCGRAARFAGRWPSRWRSPGSPALAMAATGAYAYHNIKVAQSLSDRRRHREADRRTSRRNISNTRTCRSPR